MSFIFIRYYNPSFFTDRSGPNTVHENITVCACLGYYTFDTLYYIWHWAKTSKVMLLHHVVTWYGLATCLYLQVSGTEISIIICGTEMTTPFLIAQRFLPKEGKMRRTVCFSIYVIGTALFVACRLIVGTYLMNVYLPDQKAPVIFRLLGFSLYVLGFPFFVSIVRFGVKNFRSEERERRDVNKKHVANNNHISNNGFVKID
ncbi:TLC domain-containing protein 5-like isoform X3 [Apostichopus japonicus]